LDNKEGMSVNNRLMTLVTSSVTENNQIISSANFYKSTFKYDLDNYPTEQVSEASISNNGYLKVEYFY
jgi:thiamine pyrophosphokinase